MKRGNLEKCIVLTMQDVSTKGIKLEELHHLGDRRAELTALNHSRLDKKFRKYIKKQAKKANANIAVIDFIFKIPNYFTDSAEYFYSLYQYKK